MISNTSNPNNQDNFHKDVSVNIVNVSVDEQRVVSLAKLVTDTTGEWKGFWIKTDSDYKMFFYNRWPGCSKTLTSTLYADAMIVEVENESEFKQVEEYVRSRGRIPLIIFYSDYDFSAISKSFKNSSAKWVKKSENDAEKLRQLILSGYHELNKTIRETFDKFDLDKNGTIEREEIEKAAVDLGENISSEEFMECFNVIDVNKDGVISFNEFLTWWKLGRQNSQTMKKLVQLQLMTSNLNSNYLENIIKELENVKSTEESISKHYLKFYSENVENPGMQIFFKLMKGPDRVEPLHAYLLRFSNHVRTQHSRFIDIVFSLDNSADKNEFLNYAKGMLDMVIDMLSSLDSNFAELFRLFIFVEYLQAVNENSVVLRFRQKVDSQKLIDDALFPVLTMLNLISGNQEILFDFKNKLSIKEIFESNLTVLEALAKYSLELKINVDREHIRRLAKENPLAYFLTAPHDLQLSCRMDIEKLIPKSAKPVLQQPLGMYQSLIQNVLMMAGDTSMLSKVTSVEVNLNAYDIFAEIKLKLPGLFN